MTRYMPFCRRTDPHHEVEHGEARYRCGCPCHEGNEHNPPWGTVEKVNP